MKAFIYEKYGSPEKNRMAEVEQARADAGEVLVKVLGISVNAADLYSLRGKPCSHGPPWVAAAQTADPRCQTLSGRWRRPAAASPGSGPAHEVYGQPPEHGYGGFAE